MGDIFFDLVPGYQTWAYVFFDWWLFIDNKIYKLHNLHNWLYTAGCDLILMLCCMLGDSIERSSRTRNRNPCVLGPPHTRRLDRRENRNVHELFP